MKIYTKNGDNYFSSLCNGKKLHKSHIIFQILGDLDELNVFLNLVLLQKKSTSHKNLITEIQAKIVQLSGEIAQFKKGENISAIDTQKLEESIDLLSKNNEVKPSFMIRDKNQTSALLQICRVICRRCERGIAVLNNSVPETELHISHEIFIFINRLSDLLFVLAQSCEK